MTTKSLADWVDLVDNFVANAESSLMPSQSEDQSEIELSINDWDQNMVYLWQKCSDSASNAHMATIFKHIYLAAFGLAAMFKVNVLHSWKKRQ